MSNKKVSVKVNWCGEKALSLPSGKQYITVAKFSEDIHWKNDAWSIILEFIVSPDKQGNPSEGSAHFLMPNAPLERLKVGSNFELYEGNSLVAKVEVI